MEDNATVVRQTQRPAGTCVTLQNDDVRVAFLPASGGRMTELTHLETGRQHLRRPQPLTDRRAAYGDDFAAHGPSGFDECFPTVAPSTYRPDGKEGAPLALPDHGELWSRSWAHAVSGEALHLKVEGVQLDYRFEKEIRLAESSVHIHYRLESREAFPFPYLWSAHPLLEVEPGARIVLPPEVEAVRIESASTPALDESPGGRSWPHLAGPSGPDYSRVQPATLKQAVKCFTPALEDGWAEVHAPGDTGNVLRMRFRAGVPLYLGLWLCYGGWPPDAEEKHHTIALEPTTAPCDALHEAALQEACPVIQPGAVHAWTLELEAAGSRAIASGGADL